MTWFDWTAVGGAIFIVACAIDFIFWLAKHPPDARRMPTTPVEGSCCIDDEIGAYRRIEGSCCDEGSSCASIRLLGDNEAAVNVDELSCIRNCMHRWASRYAGSPHAQKHVSETKTLVSRIDELLLRK